MSIMELGALGEFVGSILVLVTLVYLAVQIRQGIAHARFTTTHAIIGTGHSMWVAIARSPELAAVMTKLESGDPLVGPEPAQVYAFATHLMIFYINAQSALHERLIPHRYLPTYQADLRRILTKYPKLRTALSEMVVQIPALRNDPIWEPLHDEAA